MNYNYGSNNYSYGGQTAVPTNYGQVYPQTTFNGNQGSLGVRNTIPYATEDEVKAYILAPNMQMFAIDREKPYFYIKSADSLGRSVVDKFKFSKVEEDVEETPTKDYVTKDDIKDFVSRKEFNSLMAQCKDIEKLLKVGGKKDGKESA